MQSPITPIITIDREAPKPLHRQIYDAYRDAIVGGTLRPGQRVPSTRSLAAELRLSRMPVLNAYAQLLAEGYFQSRSGAGTTVCESLPDERLPADPQPSRILKTLAGGRSRKAAQRIPVFVDNPPWIRGWGAFGVGQVASEHFPFRQWNRLIARNAREKWAQSRDYGHPLGLLELREAVASYLRTARGAQCEAEQIMIVSGSQQAVDISARALLGPGSEVWMEEPGYRYARYVLGLNDCRLVPVPVDDQGLNVAVGIRRSPNARAALVTPSHQYPLGVTMNASRRLQLLDWAARKHSWILEDDYDSEFRYDTLPIASLQGLDSNARVVYIGTFSKVLFPSLRLGYLVIPHDLVERFRAVRVAMDIGPATFFQRVLADFIQEGHFSRHIRKMRLLYRERRNALVDNIKAVFGETVRITGEQAGMHVTIIVDGISDCEVVARATRAGLWLVPLSSCFMGKTSRQGFILGFGSVPTNQIANAVRKLRELTRPQVRGRSAT